MSKNVTINEFVEQAKSDLKNGSNEVLKRCLRKAIKLLSEVAQFLPYDKSIFKREDFPAWGKYVVINQLGKAIVSDQIPTFDNRSKFWYHEAGESIAPVRMVYLSGNYDPQNYQNSMLIKRGRAKRDA